MRQVLREQFLKIRIIGVGRIGGKPVLEPDAGFGLRRRGTGACNRAVMRWRCSSRDQAGQSRGWRGKIQPGASVARNRCFGRGLESLVRNPSVPRCCINQVNLCDAHRHCVDVWHVESLPRRGRIVARLDRLSCRHCGQGRCLRVRLHWRCGRCLRHRCRLALVEADDAKAAMPVKTAGRVEDRRAAQADGHSTAFGLQRPGEVQPAPAGATLQGCVQTPIGIKSESRRQFLPGMAADLRPQQAESLKERIADICHAQPGVAAPGKSHRIGGTDCRSCAGRHWLRVPNRVNRSRRLPGDGGMGWRSCVHCRWQRRRRSDMDRNCQADACIVIPAGVLTLQKSIGSCGRHCRFGVLHVRHKCWFSGYRFRGGMFCNRRRQGGQWAHQRGAHAGGRECHHMPARRGQHAAADNRQGFGAGAKEKPQPFQPRRCTGHQAGHEYGQPLAGWIATAKNPAAQQIGIARAKKRACGSAGKQDMGWRARRHNHWRAVAKQRRQGRIGQGGIDIGLARCDMQVGRACSRCG